ncbi:MAG: hypothetical protein U9Q77_11495 [Candidatus Marinimicrobia bacterium]|nr:hypothetical protein [Candidatus Neomarinimicrobiota bacterium]
MNNANMYPPVFWTYPHTQDSLNVILFNGERASEWEKVNSYLEEQGGYINNAKVRELTGLTDRSAVSRLLKKWVERGFLRKYQPSAGGYKNVKYALNSSAPDVKGITE